MWGRNGYGTEFFFVNKNKMAKFIFISLCKAFLHKYYESRISRKHTHQLRMPSHLKNNTLYTQKKVWLFVLWRTCHFFSKGRKIKHHSKCTGSNATSKGHCIVEQLEDNVSFLKTWTKKSLRSWSEGSNLLWHLYIDTYHGFIATTTVKCNFFIWWL